MAIKEATRMPARRDIAVSTFVASCEQGGPLFVELGTMNGAD
jgi:hypothetical protein